MCPRKSGKNQCSSADEAGIDDTTLCSGCLSLQDYATPLHVLVYIRLIFAKRIPGAPISFSCVQQHQKKQFETDILVKRPSNNQILSYSPSAHCYKALPQHYQLLYIFVPPSQNGFLLHLSALVRPQAPITPILWLRKLPQGIYESSTFFIQLSLSIQYYTIPLHSSVYLCPIFAKRAPAAPATPASALVRPNASLPSAHQNPHYRRSPLLKSKGFL